MRWLLPQDFELVSTEGHESLEHVSQQDNQLIILLYRYRYAHAVYTGLDHTCLLFTLRNDDRIEHQRRVVLELNLWMDLSLNNLRREVTQVEAGFESVPDVEEIVFCCHCHFHESIFANSFN